MGVVAASQEHGPVVQSGTAGASQTTRYNTGGGKGDVK